MGKRVYIQKVPSCRTQYDGKNTGQKKGMYTTGGGTLVYDAELVRCLRALGFKVVRREDVEEKEE
jgi:hypothetical protein